MKHATKLPEITLNSGVAITKFKWTDIKLSWKYIIGKKVTTWKMVGICKCVRNYNCFRVTWSLSKFTVYYINWQSYLYKELYWRLSLLVTLELDSVFLKYAYPFELCYISYINGRIFFFVFLHASAAMKVLNINWFYFSVAQNSLHIRRTQWGGLISYRGILAHYSVTQILFIAYKSPGITITANASLSPQQLYWQEPHSRWPMPPPKPLTPIPADLPPVPELFPPILWSSCSVLIPFCAYSAITCANTRDRQLPNQYRYIDE